MQVTKRAYFQPQNAPKIVWRPGSLQRSLEPIAGFRGVKTGREKEGPRYMKGRGREEIDKERGKEGKKGVWARSEGRPHV